MTNPLIKKRSRTDLKSKFLNELVIDCLTFRLNEAESLAYIKLRFGEPISLGSYKRRRIIVNSDTSIQKWLNYFTRIGFVKHHKEIIDNARVLLADSNRRLIMETSQEVRNEDRIFKLKADIRESLLLLSELGLGTPIIAEIRAKLAKKEEAQSQNAQVVP